MGQSRAVVRASVFLLLCSSLVSHTATSSTAQSRWIARGGLHPGCRENERQALLHIKRRLTDPANRLSSWAGHDCCAWAGVLCNDSTGHVVKLKLRRAYTYEYIEPLGGDISPSLLELTHLAHLDLSRNNFTGTNIPSFMGSLSSLRFLNLAESGFVGPIPPHLGNLSNLHHLDVSSKGLHAENLHWVSRLSALRYLDMSRADLSKATDWVHSVNMLPQLRTLVLEGCSPNTQHATLPMHVNLSSLVDLNLQDNFHLERVPPWLYNLSKIEKIELSNTGIQGPISGFGSLPSLRFLYLSSSNIQGPLPGTFKNLSNLQELDLSSNRISGEIPVELMSGLAQFRQLRSLDLSGNLLSGSIPPSIGGVSSLRELSLEDNKLEGFVPETLGRLGELVFLDLRLNSLTGVISDAHLANLSRLQYLFLSSNSLALNFTSHWIPPFQLNVIDLRSCRLGPQFPTWLRTQHYFSALDISGAGISDVIPDWFWDSRSSDLAYLNVSHNNLSGNLSTFTKFRNIEVMDLGSNNFHGPFPQFNPNFIIFLSLSHNSFSGQLPAAFLEYSEPHFVSLSNNHFSGSIPSSVCKATTYVSVLDLSSNHISGEIPRCWNTSSKMNVLNLRNNSLHGSIPAALGSLQNLRLLDLSKNNLSGKIPSSLRKCEKLIVLDLVENMLTGNIPPWIGDSLLNLRILRLRSNRVHGSIPMALANLRGLQILDIAFNNLSGNIPPSFGRFSSMATTATRDGISTSGGPSGNGIYSMLYVPYYVESLVIVMKGRELQYEKTLFQVACIDLSSNSLSGPIPEEIGNLAGLQNLALSKNLLTGKIPEKIGNMRWLEGLDLSSNQLVLPDLVISPEPVTQQLVGEDSIRSSTSDSHRSVSIRRQSRALRPSTGEEVPRRCNIHNHDIRGHQQRPTRWI